MCSTRSVAVTPSLSDAGEVYAHDFRREEIDRLAEHAGLRLDAADAPADDAEAVDHGGVRVGADERIRVVNAVFLQHALREVLQIHLVHDANARRYYAESFEGLLAPFQELVALAVALEFQLHVALQRIARAEEIDLHGVVHHQIDRHQRLDDPRVAAEPRHG